MKKLTLLVITLIMSITYSAPLHASSSTLSSPVWTHQFGDEYPLIPTLSDLYKVNDKFFIHGDIFKGKTSMDRLLWSFDSNTGKEIFSTSTTQLALFGQGNGVVVDDKGNSFISYTVSKSSIDDAKSNVIAKDPKGKTLWSKQFNTWKRLYLQSNGTLLISNSNSSDGSEVIVYNKSGKELYRKTLNGYMITVNNGHIVTVSNKGDKFIYTVYKSNLQLAYSFGLPKQGQFEAILPDGTMLYSLKSKEGVYKVVAVRNGKELWFKTLSSNYLATDHISNDKVLFYGENNLYLFNKNGLVTYRTFGKFNKPQVSHTNELLIETNNTLIILDGRNLAMKYSVNIPSEWAALKDAVYYYGGNGTLFFYDWESKQLSKFIIK